MNIKPETAEKFQKVQRLLVSEKIDGDPITVKQACKRADLSLAWYFKMRRYADLGFQIEVKTNAAQPGKENRGVDVHSAEHVRETRAEVGREERN